MAELKISYDEHFALIVGINEYKNLNNLEYAVNDAKAIYNILKDKFGYKKENMKLILDKDANKENIMNAYYEIAKNYPFYSYISAFVLRRKSFPISSLQRAASSSSP